MKTNFLKHMMLLQVVLVCLIGNAQVTTKTFSAGIPAELIKIGVKDIPDILIKAPAELGGLLTGREIIKSDGLSFKFATVADVDIDVLSKARMIEENGYITYITTITAENALSVSFRFKEFYLPEHALMQIYTHNELTGDITAKENNEDKKWGTRVYHSNQVTISVRIPLHEKDKAVLKINKVSFGYKQPGGDNLGNPGWSADCNINIRCPLGNNWQNESNSVALITSDNFFFTGSLIMNACKTRTPYILTAYHNIDQPVGADVNPENCTFTFKYRRVSCDNNSEWNEDISFFSSVFKAGYEPTDFMLLQLAEIPPVTSQLYYSGWDRSAAVPTGPITVIHHPMGDLMKISQTTGSIQQVAWYGGAFDHWQGIFGSGMGVVQPGSSGAPMYDQNHRIIGQHHGNQIYPGCGEVPFSNCACEASNIPGITKGQITEGGKFSDSWTGGGTPTSQLSHWLDPFGLGNYTTNTTSIYDLQPDPYVAQIQGDNSICSLNTSKVYSIDLPPGATISSWGQSNSSVSITPISSNTVSVKYINTLNSMVTITANVVLNGPCNQGTYPRPKTIRLGGASCTTRTAYQMVNGNPVQIGNCVRLTQLRSIYVKGKESKPGLTEYYTNAWVVDSDPTATIEWSFVSASAYGYPSYIANGANVEVIISNSMPYGWIRLKCTTTTSCGAYAQDYWFTPQPSTTSCPIFNPCLVAQKSEGFINTSSEKISLSPNPTNGQFKVLLSSDVQDAVIREIRIKNKMGVAVYQQVYKNSQKERTVNLYNLPTDIYLIEVFDGKKWMTEKLSLQR